MGCDRRALGRIRSWVSSCPLPGIACRSALGDDEQFRRTVGLIDQLSCRRPDVGASVGLMPCQDGCAAWPGRRSSICELVCEALQARVQLVWMLHAGVHLPAYAVVRAVELLACSREPFARRAQPRGGRALSRRAAPCRAIATTRASARPCRCSPTYAVWGSRRRRAPRRRETTTWRRLLHGRPSR